MSQRCVDGHRLVRDRRKRRSISVRSHELQRYWIRSLPSPSGSTFSSFIVLLQTIQVIRSKSGLRSSFTRPVGATASSRHLCAHCGLWAYLPALRTPNWRFNACWFPAIFLDRSWRRRFAVRSLDCPAMACPSVDGPLIGLLSGIVFGGFFAHRAFLQPCINRSSDRGCGSRAEDDRRLMELRASEGVHPSPLPGPRTKVSRALARMQTFALS